MNIRRITVALFLAFAPLCAAQEPAQPDAGPVAVVASKEYFVQQGAGEVLVVRIRAFEAEFVSRLSTDEGETLAESGLAEARMLPLYQFLAEPGAPRQVNIDVAATQVTARTAFELELIRLNVRDERSARQANAYRFLSLGLESLPGGNVPDWTVKIQALVRAEGLFEEIGMEELRLRCRVYAAHLVLHRLRDTQTALDWAEAMLASPRIDRFPDIAFAASRIRSSALLGAGRGAGGDDPAASPLQRALDDTVRRARSLDYRYEEALALQASAVDLKGRGYPAEALEQFQAALAVAEQIAAADLATSVREHIVGIHEEFGDLEASGNVLQDIESHLLSTGESEELARNLVQQGRLQLAGYRYAAAIDALSRAAQLEQSAFSRIQVELALADALHRAGRPGEALVHFNRAVIQPDSGAFRKPGPALDLFSALGDIADIHRLQEDFEPMNRIRSAQQDYAREGTQRAEWAYQRAVDALLERGPAASGVRERFETAQRQQGATGGGAWQALSLLHLCALPALVSSDDPRCEDAVVARAREQARVGGPRHAAESALLYSRLLGLRGQTGRAMAVAEALVDELLGSGREPLGAWYWQWRGLMYENYVGLAMRAETADDAAGSLLALARARLIERGGRTPFHPDANALEAMLAGLPRDAAVLAFFLTGTEAQAWLARRSGVLRRSLDGARAIVELCANMREAIQAGGWSDQEALSAQLGARLLDPLAGLLPETLLLVSHGPLLGIPFDSLALDDGTPLAQQHQLIQLDAFPAALEPAGPLHAGWPVSVFLAGDPLDWSGDYAVRLEPSVEVRSVTGRFVGPGLHAVQGVALLRDEFADERFAGADLVHLSIPGIVDLTPARDSALFLSEPARGEGRQRLTAAALGDMPLRAGLAFLSRTEFKGRGAMLESELGLVSAALKAGAGAVIATLWPVDDAARARFVSALYANLEDSGDLAAALAQAKRGAMREGTARDWAGFQLFLD